MYMCPQCRERFGIDELPSVLGVACFSPGTAAEVAEPETKKAKTSIDDTANGAKSPYCYTCLGLLEGVYVERLVEDVAVRVEKGEYRDLDTFHCCISVPLSLVVRRGAMIQLLRYTLGDAKFRTPDDNFVKDNLKTDLNRQLERRLRSIRCSGASPFEINIKFDHDGCDSDCSLLSRLSLELKTQKKRRKRRRWTASCEVFCDDPEFSSQSVKTALLALRAENCISSGLWLLQTVSSCTFTVGFSRKPLYLGGRYCKYSRDLSQTPWVIEGVRKCETSVEELISGKLAAAILSTSSKFCSSGREDVDVRMLGDGRPFVIEFCNPKRVRFTAQELAGLQESINSGTTLVRVCHLSVIPPEALKLLKDGEEDKVKTYAALIWTRLPVPLSQLEKLGAIKDLVVSQKTPIRVLHRRTLAVRRRVIYSLAAAPIDEHHFKLTLQTQAGTYIKEFVHGDLGRTEPSLGSLLGYELDIVALDVMKVLLDWPPPDPPGDPSACYPGSCVSALPPSPPSP